MTSTASLTEVALLSSGKSIKPGGTGEFPVLGSNGLIGRTDQPMHNDAVVIGRVGAYCGSVVLAEGPFWASDNTIVCKPVSGHTEDLRFLAYVLTAMKLNRLAGGAAQPLLTQQVLKPLEIPWPDKLVREKVASTLGSFDDLIENNRRRIEILEEMARLLYREWFVHFRFPGHEDVEMVESELGPIPEGWEVTALGDYATYVNRGIAPKYSEESEELVINQRCIRDGRLSLDNARRHIKNVPPDKVVQEGDVLINSTGVGTLGRVAPVREAVACATVDSHVTIVRPPEEEDNDFFAQLLLSLQSVFEAMGAGSTGQTELSRARVGELKVVRPGGTVTIEFGRLTSPMRLLHINLTKQNAALREARDLLLPRLVSGELGVSKLDLEGVMA